MQLLREDGAAIFALQEMVARDVQPEQIFKMLQAATDPTEDDILEIAWKPLAAGGGRHSASDSPMLFAGASPALVEELSRRLPVALFLDCVPSIGGHSDVMCANVAALSRSAQTL